jgi:hypothetical protein
MEALQNIISKNNLKSTEDFNDFFKNNGYGHHLYAVNDDNYTIINYKNDSYNDFTRLFNYAFINQEGKVVHYFEPKHYDNIKTNEIDTGDNNCIYLSNVSYAYTTVLYNEGSLIKVFYDDNQWHFSTSKKINAANVFWSSNEKSFKELFFDVFSQPEFSFELDKEYCYTFLLQHPENFISLPTEPNLILLNKTNTSNYKVERPVLNSYNFENLSIQDILSKERNVCENYMIYAYTLDDENTYRIKLVSDAYKERQKMLNNCSSPSYACITALKENNTEDFLTVLRDFKPLFESIQESINELCKTILIIYTLKYIAKHKTRVDKKYSKILNTCHQEYLKTRTPINIDTIKKCLFTLHTAEIKGLIC